MHQLIFLCLLSGTAGQGSPGPLQVVERKGDSGPVIDVVVPGRVQVEFNTVRGFGSRIHDLRSDPEKTRDVVGRFKEAGGLFWCTINQEDWRTTKATHDFANPPQSLALIENNAVRSRILIKGKFTKNGKGKASNWGRIDYETAFTAYPNGNFYMAWTLTSAEQYPLAYLQLDLQTTPDWGPSEKNEVRPLGEFGAQREYGDTTAWALQSSDGPTYFLDIALIASRGRFKPTYWPTNTFPNVLVRSGLDLASLLQTADKRITLPKGDTRIQVVYRLAADMNDVAAVQKWARDYREPDALTLGEGELDTTEIDDPGKDGFNEGEGCYVIRAGDGGMSCVLKGGPDFVRNDPAFKIKSWNGRLPAKILLGDKVLEAGRDYHAAVTDKVLLVQLFRTIQAKESLSLRAVKAP